MPYYALTVDKGVSLSAAGPFDPSLTTTTGTTVHYRITVTNTGDLPITNVSLKDNTFNLVAKGCVIPDTLDVGAHFDCDYAATAVTGTTTNIATGDSTETDADTGTATVTATPAPGYLKIIKKVEGGPEGFSGDFTFSIDCGQAGTFTKIHRLHDRTGRSMHRRRCRTPARASTGRPDARREPCDHQDR